MSRATLAGQTVRRSACSASIAAARSFTGTTEEEFRDLLYAPDADAVARGIARLEARSLAEAQRQRGIPVLTWTVRTSEQEATAMNAADEIIYEREHH